MFFCKLLNSSYENLRVNYYAVCDYTDGIRSDRAAGQQMQGEFSVAYDNRMACIGAPAVSDNDIALFSKDIYNFTFAFVTPL